MVGIRNRALALYAVIAALQVSGCSDDHGPPAESSTAVFEFVHTEYGEAFFAHTSDRDVIQAVRKELERPIDERSLHINGALLRGDGGVNAPWSWRFDADNWSLAELSIEVCDAWPSYVEENLDTWLDEVGSFCPWASRVVREVDRQ